MSNKDLENLLNWEGQSNKKTRRENPWVTCKGCGKKFNGEHRLEWHLNITAEEYTKLNCWEKYSGIELG